jgi:hypothetical protein
MTVALILFLLAVVTFLFAVISKRVRSEKRAEREKNQRSI